MYRNLLPCHMQVTNKISNLSSTIVLFNFDSHFIKSTKAPCYYCLHLFFLRKRKLVNTVNIEIYTKIKLFWCIYISLVFQSCKQFVQLENDHHRSFFLEAVLCDDWPLVPENTGSPLVINEIFSTFVSLYTINSQLLSLLYT